MMMKHGKAFGKHVLVMMYGGLVAFKVSRLSLNVAETSSNILFAGHKHLIGSDLIRLQQKISTLVKSGQHHF
jgi:hypothetical protein